MNHLTHHYTSERLEPLEQNMKIEISRPIIWIIGNNVLMDGVATCLEERQIPNLIRWDTLNIDLKANLQACKPILIIFELDTPGSYILLDLLREHPGINLLGVDQRCNQVILLNSSMRKTRTMSDLFQIVRETLAGGS
jgi:hypothetical protein